MEENKKGREDQNQPGGGEGEPDLQPPSLPSFLTEPPPLHFYPTHHASCGTTSNNK